MKRHVPMRVSWGRQECARGCGAYRTRRVVGGPLARRGKGGREWTSWGWAVDWTQRQIGTPGGYVRFHCAGCPLGEEEQS